jgi:anaerobic selenocysteine-containing dehydrogenase
MGGNLWGATPDTAFASRAMGAIGFKLFLTTTLNMGHVHGLGSGEVLVLPVTARDEEWEPTTQESMFNYVRLSDGGIRRLDNVRPESWILGEIGQRLLPKSPINFKAFSAHSKVREAIAAIVPGLEQLADIDVAKKEFHIKHRVMHTPEFGTPDGRAHFVVTPVPHLQRERLTLATMRSEGQFNTIIYEEKDSYRGGAGRHAVFLNSADMAAFGVSEGQKVTLASDTGRMSAIATAFDLPRGSAMAYYPEANVLVGTEVDPRSKTPAFKSVPVWIEA